MAKPRILIVEDQTNIIKVIASRLKANGYDVSSAEDGEEGLKKAKAEKPDLILLDLIMPKMNGYMVCHELRTSEECKDTPIIILSAWTWNKDDDAAATANLHMSKPFDAAELLKNIKLLLEDKASKP